MFSVNSNNDVQEFNKYKIQLKSEKAKLHTRYISCISIGICILVLTCYMVGNQSFIEQLGFASTITSIILSVVAIIMSITGEGKTESIRNQIYGTSEEMQKTAQIVKDVNNDVKISINKLQESISILQERIDEIPDKTVSFMQNKDNGLKKGQVEINNNVEWK